MNILYMNQGGGGQWGAIRYENYDLILLAESSVIKTNFCRIWTSGTSPEMSIQEKLDVRRTINTVDNLDVLDRQVRPIPTFNTRDGIRVVFVHLKSGNERFATTALKAAVTAVQQKIFYYNQRQPILWIGDFNRADDKCLINIGARRAFLGGGQAQWDLDRAYISGDWSCYDFDVTIPAIAATDHGHAAIGFTYSKK